MSKLTYPIDEKPIAEIPDLEPLVDMCWNGTGIGLFTAYRFDPRCEEVRRRPTTEEKNQMAAKLSGYTPAPGDKALLQELATCYFRILNSLDFEVMCSLEIVHDESMQMLREPITTEDAEKRLKSVELKQKIIAGMDRTEGGILTKRQKLADGDEEAAKILLETAPARKFRHNTLTGKKEEVE